MMPTFFCGKDLEAMSLRQRRQWVEYHNGPDYLLYNDEYQKFLESLKFAAGEKKNEDRVRAIKD